MNYKRMLWVGGTCLASGWVLTFLTVLQRLTPSFVLAAVCTILILVGSIVGFFGISAAFRASRTRDEHLSH